MMQTLRTALLCLCLFTLGCGKPVSETDFAKIEQGMSIQEVEGILGKGDEISADDVKAVVGTAANEGLNLETCDTWIRWGNRTKAGIIGFQNGQVRQTLLH